MATKPVLHCSVLICFFVILTGISTVNAQSAKSAYNKYEKEKYADAEEGFREVLLARPSDVLANLGMAQLCVNPAILLIPEIKDRYDYFRAFRYIRQAKKSVSPMEGEALAELNKMIKSVPDMKARVGSEYDRIETKLADHLKARKNLDSVTIFILEFPDSKYYKEILQLRYNTYFEKVKTSGDVQALNMFIEQCPDADSLMAAIQYRDDAAYDTLNSNENPSIEEVYNYLNRYPLSRKYRIIIALRDKLESERAQKEGTFEAYSLFFENFPRSTKIPGLKEKYIELFWTEARKTNTLEALNAFLDRYPLARNYAQQARHKRDSIYLERFSSSVDSLNLYITLFPLSKFLKEAVNLRDMKAYEQARQESTIAAYEDFIYRYPSALEAKEAITLRDSLVLEKVTTLSSEMDFSKLLADYPYLVHQPRTMAALEDILYREAKRLDDAEYYKEFLDRCPNSKHAEEIREKLKTKQ